MHHRLITLHCLSPLNCGTGQGISGIDLPVQREQHTQWPVIPGSSIKGVLRDATRQSTGKLPKDADSEPDVIALFGPEQSGELGLGALSFGDGVLLAFPVRSLCGVFAWVTCPMALHRLAQVASLAGIDAKAFACEAPGTDDIRSSSSLAVDDAKAQVLLEDHVFKRMDLPKGLAEAVKALFPSAAQSMVDAHLAIVCDDLFTWFARHATQVEARIALDPATKTVAKGALFYQETVPPESVFVTLISAEDARHPAAQKSSCAKADKALDKLKSLCDVPRQFGGDATIGKGLCTLAMNGK